MTSSGRGPAAAPVPSAGGALPAVHGELPRWDVSDLPAPLPFSTRNLLKVIGQIGRAHV